MKRFLEPTMLINALEYRFGALSIPAGGRLYEHTVMPVWAMSSWPAVWAEIPYRHFSNVAAGTAGVGDVMLFGVPYSTRI